MEMEFEILSRWADEELKSLVKVLPDDVREAANRVVTSLEEQPGRGMDDGDLEGDELGLFEGPCALDEMGAGEIPKIRLFLSNIWVSADKEEHDYRDEVGITFLHELGHYLGWDEDEVAERGLE